MVSAGTTDCAGAPSPRTKSCSLQVADVVPPGRCRKPDWYDLPGFFPACPGCGASTVDMDRAHLVGQGHRPWMEREGYVGEGAGGPHAR